MANRLSETSHLPEQHTPKFRGTWTPAEVHDLLAKGEITSTEFVLVTVIDSLVDARGDGCWASNEYLAKRLGGLRGDHIKHLIKHLKELGLVKQVGWKQVGHQQHRILETAWSRIQFEGGGEGGVITPPQGGGVSPPICNRNNTASQYYSSYSKRGRAAPPNQASSNGNAKPKEDTYLRQWKQLRQALRDHKRQVCGTSLQDNATELRLLHQKDGVSVQAVLDWYCHHCSIEDQSELKLPSITSAKQFRKHFEWIRQKMVSAEGVEACQRQRKVVVDLGGGRKRITFQRE